MLLGDIDKQTTSWLSVMRQAVSWLDYAWDLRRTKTCIGTPYGEQCAAPAALQTVSPLWPALPLAKQREKGRGQKGLKSGKFLILIP